MKILLIEDNPDHADLIIEACETAFGDCLQLDHKQNFKEGRATLEAQSNDIALLDLALPDSPLEDTIAYLKKANLAIPIVVLTSLNDRSVGESLIQTGVQDYLPKQDLSPTLLHRICSYSIERKRQQVSLKARNEDQQAFCRSLSHDFKNPIRNIAQLSTLIQKKLEKKYELDEDTQEVFELINKKSKAIKDLVDDLYDYLQLEVADTEFSAINMNELIEEAWDFSTSGRRDDAVLNLDKIPPVLGHRSFLFLLFQNLFANAITYTEQTPVVDVTACLENSHCEIKIKDNGIGISADQQANIFRPFKRLHDQSKYTGSGLGLSIVKRIVENHNGSISLTSKVGEGSIFSISLPCAN